MNYKKTIFKKIFDLKKKHIKQRITPRFLAAKIDSSNLVLPRIIFSYEFFDKKTNKNITEKYANYSEIFGTTLNKYFNPFFRLQKTPIIKIKFEKDEYLKKIFNPKKRVKYYLGNVNKKIKIEKSRLKNGFCIVDDSFKSNKYKKSKIPYSYFQEINDYYQRFKLFSPKTRNKFLYRPGDIQESFSMPVLTKTRTIKDKGMNVLLPLNVKRHWSDIFESKAYDIDYDSKKNVIFWRGAATGKSKRISLVERYYNYKGPELDIGFTKFAGSYEGKNNPEYIKNPTDLKQMLQYKFLISIEGNDVATNSKWILSSNSLCIQPKPKIESWFMESKLKPWIHYVPVKEDFSDLLKIYKWCMSNPKKCKKIIKNANNYVAQFMNKKNEREIINKVLEKYTSNVNLIFE